MVTLNNTQRKKYQSYKRKTNWTSVKEKYVLFRIFPIIRVLSKRIFHKKKKTHYACLLNIFWYNFGSKIVTQFIL